MISLLTPTRNRPAGVRRLIESACETSDGPLEFVFYVDDDAVYEEGVLEVPSYRPDCSMKTIIGPRITLSDMWNKCAAEATYDIWLQSDDDLKFSSQGWDTQVTDAFAAFPDKIASVYGRDGVHAPPACATQQFLSRRWAEVVGYFVPPYFSSDCSDAWIYEVALRVGRAVYLENVFTEHMHPIVGKAEWDQTYKDRLERHQRDEVDKLYKELEPQRREDASKLRREIMRVANE
jgi:hypothetical protein